MKKIIIGAPEMGHSLFRKYMKSKYAASIKRAGAQLRWLPWTEDEAVLKEYIDQCDGLLIPGGPDIAPALYGQEPSSLCGEAHPHRDAMEPPLLRAWFATQKPLLCICRGLQMLTVAEGGTLYQDIKGTQKVSHADFKGRVRGTHQVTVDKGSLLYAITGKDSLFVNSLHHQAVDALGALTVTARSEDGFVEAVELPGYPFCLAVQWHPEHMSHKDPVQQKLFDAFVSACQKGR